jgi:shikimate kinase
MTNAGKSIGLDEELQRRGNGDAEHAPAAGLRLSADHRTIVLVGLMGAGKSCVGRRLAVRLDRPFVDADAEIEAAAGCTIAEIFERFGEAAFRDGERRVMARLLDGPPTVLAAGGGAFIDPDICRLIRERALSVWLRADVDLLVRRTAGRTHRPLLRTGDPREILKGLIEKRYPIYAQADITVDTIDVSPDYMVETVLAAIEAYLASRSAA